NRTIRPPDAMSQRRIGDFRYLILEDSILPKYLVRTYTPQLNVFYRNFKARCHLKEESKTENLFKHLVFLDNEGMIVISFLVISVIVLMLIGGLGIYNRLITLRNRLKN